MESFIQSITYFFIYNQKTAFFKLEDIFPECYVYRETSPQMEPLVCLKEDACHVGKNCMETLIYRLKALFDEVVPNAELILLYYRRFKDKSNLGGGVFYRNLQDLRMISMNPYVWKRLKQLGSIYQFTPNQSFYLTKTGDISVV